MANIDPIMSIIPPKEAVVSFPLLKSILLDELSGFEVVSAMLLEFNPSVVLDLLVLSVVEVEVVPVLVVVVVIEDESVLVVVVGATTLKDPVIEG